MDKTSHCGVASRAHAGSWLPVVITTIALLTCALPGNAFDLRNAVVIAPGNLSGPEKQAVRMLIEEVDARTGIQWKQTESRPDSSGPFIVIESRSALPTRGKPESYRISVRRNETNVVRIVGMDARGVLFGIGRLLREMRMQRSSVTIADELNIESAPKYPLRGHQLGFRPKTNSYDAWDLPVWEQYFRDLAVFGCNAIELIPPRSDDAADSPHFPRSPIDMMIGMSRLADAYGLDVWIWYPALDRDYSDPKIVEFALKEWADVFARLPRIDAVFVPGGDPGHTQPKWLMSLLGKQTQNLHRYHPKAAMWVSPQGFTQEWMEEFLQSLEREPPSWLTGIVFGPQVRMSLPRLRERVPSQFPIRHYPDITHTRQCQFPVPDWDVAFAVTEARECINPRPEGEAVIFRKTQSYTMGFLTYSEGCNDDVNKVVWSALGWDPEAKVSDILREYSRYFISERAAAAFAEGLLSLEQNWQGPVRNNPAIGETLKKFQELERKATPAELRNWRFQQALFRAYYDAYVQRRQAQEFELEAQAMKLLQQAPQTGAIHSMAAAEKVLESLLTAPVLATWRVRIHELAEALFQSIGMQLSVEKYKAIAVDRGASLDTLEFPLNNRVWLKEKFAAIRQLPEESERLAAIRQIVDWTDPGPGGFYDDLGNSASQPHLERGAAFNGDPGSMESPRVGFEEDPPVDSAGETAGCARRISWMDHAETLYDTPLRMRYQGLDTAAEYKLRIVYAGDNPKRKVRLVANANHEIHPYMAKPVPFRPLEFAMPQSLTANGELSLSWFGEPGLGGNGRGCQVAEVWLIKQSGQSSAGAARK